MNLKMVADVTGPRFERESAFATLKSLLIGKYGSADNEDTERQPRAVVKTLLYYQIGYVAVQYRQIEKNPL